MAKREVNSDLCKIISCTEEDILCDYCRCVVNSEAKGKTLTEKEMFSLINKMCCKSIGFIYKPLSEL